MVTECVSGDVKVDIPVGLKLCLPDIVPHLPLPAHLLEEVVEEIFYLEIGVLLPGWKGEGDEG